MKTAMYIHGYGSDGNAMKGQLLRAMLDGWRVVSPTFDYDHLTPWQVQERIRETVEEERVALVVGSSFGGYHAICATEYYRGTVWVINPVHDVLSTICRVVDGNRRQVQEYEELYADFDRRVFRRLSEQNCQGRWPEGVRLNFALSTDDELLGSHEPLLELFPVHDRVVWKDDSRHRFLRFEELREELTATL